MMQIGEKINKLTLIGYTGMDKYSRRIGTFGCDCGNTKEILIYDVQSAHTKSCGSCNVPVEMKMKIGEIKNGLTLLGYAGKSKHSNAIGLFKCHCGKTKKY